MMRNFPLSATKPESDTADAEMGAGRRFAWDGAVATRSMAATIAAGVRNTACLESEEFSFRIMQSPWGRFPTREFVPPRAKARYWFRRGSRPVRKTASARRRVFESWPHRETEDDR